MAREAGDLCFDPSPTEGRADCHCNLPPGHGGNLHWCIGKPFTIVEHSPHFWPVVGQEVPINTFISKETQCPTCRTVFKVSDEHVGKSIVVIGEAERLALPIFQPKEIVKNGP